MRLRHRRGITSRSYRFPKGARLDLAVDTTRPRLPGGAALWGSAPCRAAASFNLRKLSIAVRSGTADAALGPSLLLLFRLASGVQVKRLDNWLHARSSGDAAVFRGQNLAAANIAADRTSR